MAVVGDIPELGKGDPQKALVMDYAGEGWWQIALPLAKAKSRIAYRYVLLQEGETPREEAGDMRELRLPKTAERIALCDTWREPTATEEAFFSAAFAEAVFKPAHSLKGRSDGARDGGAIFRFQLRASNLPPDCQIALTGSHNELGNWDTKNPILLGNADFPLWTAEVHLPWTESFEYKYGLFHTAEQRWIDFEWGDNRRWDHKGANGKASLVVVSDEYAAFNRPAWKGAGVAIPVFSLRSERSLGVGEFADLKLMADWAQENGLRLIQILPINDTTVNYTWTDSYPYSAITVFALHPMYLALDAIPGAEKTIGKKRLQELRQQLNASPVVDYDAVIQTKRDLCRKIYDAHKKTLFKDTAFQAFVEEQQHWLAPYAVFCYLRDKHATADFTQWGPYANYSEAVLKEFVDPAAATYEDIAFFYFQQFYLDAQLRDAAEYARSKGIILKGDLPIGIYRHSVDAWVAPRLYNMNGQAGAPPDPFSEIGQNWGFPTYNWEEMAKDNYGWWRQRMTQLSRYFDAYRIDHILGFFRIWEIPYEHIEGLLGKFKPALPITRHELEAEGIPFDEERFCQPYITDFLLEEWFDGEADWVKETFLVETSFRRYGFKPNLNSQRKVEAFFEDEGLADRLPLKEKVLRLFAEVLFFEHEGSNMQAFHPRIDYMATHAFQSLPLNQQDALRRLHHDYFYNRQEAFWKQEAMKKLPALKKATNMLICGEDLGMVPACVPGVMKEMGMLSLEIQRMSKNPATEFLRLEDIPYLAVTSPSTHDMAPIRAWWEEMDREQVRRFFHNELGLEGEPPLFCEPYVAQAIIRQHLHWPNMWAVFPLQDILAMDGSLRRENPFEERINVPSNPKNYWQYRMHLTLERLQQAAAFNDLLRGMIRAADR